LMLQNKRVLYNLLFRCVAATLSEVAANPKRLGAEIGFLCVLHTWGQTLIHHPHIHCVVPAGGFAWPHSMVRPKCRGFFLPKDVLSEVFRGKFTDGLKGLFRRKQLAFHGSLAWLAESSLVRSDSCTRSINTSRVVYVKKPFAGAQHVLHYLARYTPTGCHPPTIRLIGMEDGKVTFPLEGLRPRRRRSRK